MFGAIGSRNGRPDFACHVTWLTPGLLSATVPLGIPGARLLSEMAVKPRGEDSSSPHFFVGHGHFSLRGKFFLVRSVTDRFGLHLSWCGERSQPGSGSGQSEFLSPIATIRKIQADPALIWHVARAVHK